MSDGAAPVIPKVGDQYWLNYAETIVNSGVEKRDKAASTIQTFAAWLWGIYTASAAVGFVLAGKDLAFWPTLIIAMGSVSLIAVYWGTVWVQMPVPVEFDPRSPDDIIRVYVTNVVNKGRRLNITLGLSVLATLAVSAALVAASMARPNKSVGPSFSATLTTQDGARVLSVTGYIGKAKSTNMRISPVSSGAAENEIQTGIYVPAENGLIQTSTRLKTNAQEVLVALEWEDANGVSTRLIRKVGEEKQSEQKQAKESKSDQKKAESKESKGPLARGDVR